MSPSWTWSDKITNECVARVGYNHFISNKGKWNNCFSKFSNQVLPPIFISTISQSIRKEKLAHFFPYDIKLGLLADSRSFSANQKARNAIVGAENLLNIYIYILRNEITKCIANFGNFKRTLETVSQMLGQTHCKDPNTATLHAILCTTWLYGYNILCNNTCNTKLNTEIHVTKCCRWCIHKEICWAQCCRSRTKFYCCNNAHYCSQKRQVDTQYNLATARNCVMYLGLNECGNHSDSVCMFFLNHCCSNTCDFRLNQSCNSLLSKNIKWNWNSWWKLSQIPVHPLRMASLLEIL